jgi:hypothetical protein
MLKPQAPLLTVVKVRAQPRLGYMTPSKTMEQKWLDDVQKNGQPQIGLGKFLVRLLVDLSRKNNDPHRDSRDAPEAPCRND